MNEQYLKERDAAAEKYATEQWGEDNDEQFYSIKDFRKGSDFATSRILGELGAVREMVDQQAEDEGLWSTPWEGLQPISEAHLQQELRRLHSVIEKALESMGVKSE